MTRLSRKQRILWDLNELLAPFDLPVIEDIREVSPNLLLALYECLQDRRLPGALRGKRSQAAIKVNLVTLMATMMKDVHGLNLDRFDVDLICAGDMEHLLHFLEIFVSLGRVIGLSRGVVQQCANDDELETSTSMASEISTSLEHQTPNSNGIEQISRESGRQSTKSGHCTDRPSCRSHLTQKTSPQLKKATPRKRTKLTRCITRRSIGRLQNLKDDSVSQSPSMVHNHRVRSMKPYKNPVLTPQAAQNLKRGECCNQFSAHDDTDLSFVTEQSLMVTPRRNIVVDSPYTKYLKARRDLVLQGIGHQLSPIRSSPLRPPWQAKTRPGTHGIRWRNADNYRQSPLKSVRSSSFPRASPLRWTSSDKLNCSISTSHNSDQSFYAD